MPFRQQSIMDERIRFVIEAKRRGRSFSSLCRSFEISRPTGYLWLKRYDETGSLSSLKEKSRRPFRMPRMTLDVVVDRIVILRMIYGWGARKLQLLLAKEGIRVGESTINRVLKRHGLVKVGSVEGQATGRFAREHPNELWQMDFKGDYPLGKGRCYPLSIIDDHSRFALGVFALDGQTGHAVNGCLVTAFERYGVPEAILTDHGIPWWSSNGHGLTWLAVSLIKQGIHLCFSGLRHPQTQGKVERFHRTMADTIRHRGRPATLPGWQRTLDEFVSEYNHLRGHESLQMKVPASCYQSSSRAYQPHPPQWEYEGDGPVIRLNSQGVLTWQSRRHFVSEALANERVQLQLLDGTLAVRFRHMWIREIDLKAGRSFTLIDKNKNPYV